MSQTVGRSKNDVQSCLLSFSCRVVSDSLLTPWAVAHQTFLSITVPQSLLRFMYMESVMLSNHLILCYLKEIITSYLSRLVVLVERRCVLFKMMLKVCRYFQNNVRKIDCHHIMIVSITDSDCHSYTFLIKSLISTQKESFHWFYTDAVDTGTWRGNTRKNKSQELPHDSHKLTREWRCHADPRMQCGHYKPQTKLPGVAWMFPPKADVCFLFFICFRIGLTWKILVRRRENQHEEVLRK